MTLERRARQPATAVAAAVFTLIVIALGGGTASPISDGVVLGIGLLLFVLPPRVMPPMGMLVLGSALLAFASTCFLPAAWFHLPNWRALFAAESIPVHSSASPQPLVSLDGLICLAAGIGWAAWLAASRWTADTRRAGVRTLAVGIGLLAIVIIFCNLFKVVPPGWRAESPVGPFPNRNHTANVLAIGALFSAGVAIDCYKQGWRAMVPWITCTAVILPALAISYSRGGLLVFTAGIAISGGLLSYTRGSWRPAVIAASALLFALSLFLLSGAPLLRRLTESGEADGGLRPKIWLDAVGMIADSPACGVGLGNFEPVFPSYRHASVIQARVLHPESDWLLLTCEAGLGAGAIALIACIWAVAAALPITREAGWRLRTIAIGASAASLLHGAFDVPLHRWGSALLFLFSAGAALRQRPFQSAKWTPLVARLAGALLFGAGLWLCLKPNPAKLAREELEAGRLPETVEAADRALEQTPLDWTLWFTRAIAEANRGETLQALRDFRRARVLEPHDAGVPMQEGLLWVRLKPPLALPAWRDALSRVEGDDANALYAEMFDKGPHTPEFRAGLLDLAANRPSLLLDWFELAPPDEARQEADEIGASIARLKPSLREAFLTRAEALGTR